MRYERKRHDVTWRKPPKSTLDFTLYSHFLQYPRSKITKKDIQSVDVPKSEADAKTPLSENSGGARVRGFFYTK